MQRFRPRYIQEANEVLHGVGLNVSGQQIEAAERLGAELTANQVAGGYIKFLSLHFDARVHFTGDVMPGHVPLAVMRSGDSNYHGDQSTGGDLCGFGNKVRATTDVHWVGTMDIMYVPNLMLHHYLNQCGAASALERIDRFNAVRFAPGMETEFLRMHRLGLQGKIDCDEQIMDMLLSMLNQPIDLTQESVEIMDFDLASVQAVIKAIKENAAARNKPLQMIDLLALEGVTAADTKLKKLMKGHLYGLSALKFQKFCRMQELYLSLAAGEYATVKEAIAAHRFHGFGIYADFANFFGRTPAEVLESAPKCSELNPTSEFGAVA